MEEGKKPTIKYTLLGTDHVFYSRKEAKAVMGNGRFARAMRDKKILVEYL